MSFTASTRKWSEKAKRNVTLVLRQSTQDVIEDAQLPTAQGGRMRVKTSFLRNSLIIALNGSTSLTGPDSYTLMIARMGIGDVLFAGWTAEYARPREFGARGQTPDFFMRGAALKWQNIVRANALKVG